VRGGKAEQLRGSEVDDAATLRPLSICNVLLSTHHPTYDPRPWLFAADDYELNDKMIYFSLMILEGQ
jgi:hypothetical protein